MKRLSGWDAVLLYSETPMVHMHTLKLAVITLDGLGDRHFGVEEFRQVIHGRLYKLSERGFDAMAKGYERGLDVALRHSFITLLIFLATVAATLLRGRPIYDVLRERMLAAGLAEGRPAPP